MKRQKNKLAHNRKDYTGLKTEYLTALKYVHSKNNRAVWEFQCKCGTIKEISAYRVANNIIKSCGCIKDVKKPQSFIKRLFHIYKKSAIKRGYTFEISLLEFKKIIMQNCFFCGDSPEMTTSYEYLVKGYYIPVNGIDRKNNSLGYDVENCVPCCKVCNVMKKDLSVDTFINKCSKILKNKKV